MSELTTQQVPFSPGFPHIVSCACPSARLYEAVAGGAPHPDECAKLRSEVQQAFPDITGLNCGLAALAVRRAGEDPNFLEGEL